MLEEIDDKPRNPNNTFCVAQCIFWLRKEKLPGENEPTEYHVQDLEGLAGNRRDTIYRKMAVSGLRPGLYKRHERTSPATSLRYVRPLSALVLFESLIADAQFHVIAIRWNDDGTGQLFDPNTALYRIRSIDELMGVCGLDADNNVFNYLAYKRTTVMPHVPAPR